MKLIVITGLAGLEKGKLALNMARSLSSEGKRVAVLDHSENNPLPTRHDDAWTFERLTGELAAQLPTSLEKAQAHHNDYILLNAAESLSPVQLYADLDSSVAQLANLSMDDVRVLAILDDRTCNCFPHVQDLLESYADLTLRYPFTLQEALAIL